MLVIMRSRAVAPVTIAFAVVASLACGASSNDGDGSIDDSGASSFDTAHEDAPSSDVTIDSHIDSPLDSIGGPVDAIAVDADARPDGPPACASGGQLGTSKGLEAPWGTAVVGVCRRALGCPSTWTFAAPDLADEDVRSRRRRQPFDQRDAGADDRWGAPRRRARYALRNQPPAAATPRSSARAR
jgi:hypothetical protein